MNDVDKVVEFPGAVFAVLVFIATIVAVFSDGIPLIKGLLIASFAIFIVCIICVPKDHRDKS